MPPRRACALLRLMAPLFTLPIMAQTPLAPLLAPTGTLRAAFLADNPVLGRIDPQSGAVTGPVADLVKELARRIGVPYKLIPAAGARDIITRLEAHTADLGFMAYNAARAAEVDFSAPWLLMPNSYIVRADSPLRNVDDADRVGVKITAVKNDTQDVYLSAHLKNNHVHTVPAMLSPEEIAILLLSGKADAFAANRQRLMEAAARLPKLRVLPDNYFVAGQAVALAKGDPARLGALNRLLGEVLASGSVKTSIDRAGLLGVEAAVPLGRK
ncbi:MAG: transporter substrate-binding domain-containing protein [Acidobacteriota bacterium]